MIATIRYFGASLRWAGALTLGVSLSACVETAPPEIVQAIESLDEDLRELRAAEVAPAEYAAFAHQWVTLQTRVQAEEDTIRWPWEPRDLEQALRRLQLEGAKTVARLAVQREAERRAAAQQLGDVEAHARVIASQVSAIDSRVILAEKPVETDLLLKQARAFYEQGRYQQSLNASDRASRHLAAQSTLLQRELGRYASPQRIAQWQRMARETIDWSKKHRASAIVISKAERSLTLYRGGQKVLSYPVRLGFNGIKEKRYQGDGATPEGRYRVAAKRGRGQTQYYRALLLDYPNQEDRRRFMSDRRKGKIPAFRDIGGQIEIHGVDNELMAQTLGCVMLENPQMAVLFERVESGTPVTIVGALLEQNAVARALVNLSARRNEV
ncbi:MAG TPA: L,D-transpeptidase [Nitrospira sp.]|nr:L,D-transpeptidase [Nitrospira sp.]